jgi:transposase
MIRSRTVNTIRELQSQGRSIYSIAREVGLSRNTVRKYLRGAPHAAARPPKGSKLDPYKGQIRRWVHEDRLLNCVVMLERLRPLGYTGGITVLKDFVHDLRPPRAGHHPIRRYETKPGEQMQIDWGEFLYEHEGRQRKVYGFGAILSYSRMRFIVFTKRCDTSTLIRCVMAACDYLGGLPHAILADRMKSVLVGMDGNMPQWNSQFADFLSAIGVVPRVCKPYTPQTKGKIERSIGIVKQSFWPGVSFTDLGDLNHQARSWCDRLNDQLHMTTRARPVERLLEEKLRPLPGGFSWERFRSEDRQVSWDGYVSYDGVLYGVPSDPPVAGASVQVSVSMQGEVISIFHKGQMIAQHTVRAASGTLVPHPDQFRNVEPAHSFRRLPESLGHQVEPPLVARRALVEYDQLCGLAISEVTASVASVASVVEVR